MKVQDAMTRDVELMTPEKSICDAAKKMREEAIGALPVGENDRLVGMITDRDITVRAVALERDPKTTRIRDVMSEKVCYCFEDDALQKAATIMSEHQVKRLPVLNRNKRLVGVISLADLEVNEPEAAQIALHGISRSTGEARQMTH